MGGSQLLALGLAPALGAALAGITALVAPPIGLTWSLLPFLLGAVVMIVLALGLRRLGIRLPSTVLDGRLAPRRAVLGAPLWLAGAVAVAVLPIAHSARRPDAVLERWDTLYHLSALARARETGTASSLALGSVSNTAGVPTAYPAGFHALAGLVPGVEVPIVLNGAVLALAILPWVLGITILARALFPAVGWAPFAAATVAAVIPASPLDLWIHLSPIPNLSGFAALPGALAAATALWTALLPAGDEHRPRGPRFRAAGASLIVVGGAGLGLGLLHPNVAVTALLLLAVVTATTCAPLLRSRPGLVAIPALALLPVALLAYTPLGSAVTGFAGGLEVPWWTALGEVLLGLLTVWPMALGVVIALLWWPGLVTSFRSPQRWVGIAWLVVAVMYLDAALDSPLNLSVLYYRGQDRISMPLAMLSAVLVVPGLQSWTRLLRRTVPRPEPVTGRRARAPLAAMLLVVLAAGAVLGSAPARSDNAAKNLAWDYPGRGRFLQQDELAAWAEAAPQMDPDLRVISSPFTGASHMYALTGQQVYFPVAGISLTDEDRNLIWSVPLAAESRVYCQSLLDHDIGYVYQDRTPYAYDSRYAPLDEAEQDLGNVLFETEHSRLIEIDCKSLHGRDD
jgi:hypothetical protein